MVRLARKLFHTTDHYDGDKLFTIHNGRRAMTPMLLVMVAIAGTDLMFALDSIPAIFGLTQNVFLVFTATAFSLLGLRQLYFLLDGLLDRLIYLSYGLAAILGFIGVKLILHALHENNVPVHQRRAARAGRRGEHRALPHRDPRGPGRHRGRLPGQPRRQGADRHRATLAATPRTTSTPSTPPTRPSGNGSSGSCSSNATKSSPSARSTGRMVRDEAGLMDLLQRARDSHDAALARGESSVRV